MWRKSLHVVPLTEISSDRFCAIQLQPSNSPPITIITVYLPCSAYSNDTYSSYFQDLQSVIGRYEVDGPIIICGDFNVDVSSHHSDSRQMQLADLLDTHSLYIVSQSSLHQGPNYTFFRDSHFSTLDYIVASSSIASTTLSCFTHPYHPLNLSDHLPLSISLDMVCPSVIPSVSSRRHAGLRLWNHKISLYEQAVTLVIQPLLNINDQSIENINDEICFVCQVLLSSVESYLPLKKHSTKKRKFFNSPELKDLCRASKQAWSA